MMACHADRPAGRRPDELGAALFINQHFGCRCTNSPLSKGGRKKEWKCCSFANSSTQLQRGCPPRAARRPGDSTRKRGDLGLRGEYPLSPAERAIALVATMTRMRALLSRHSMEVSDFGCCREMDQ